MSGAARSCSAHSCRDVARLGPLLILLACLGALTTGLTAQYVFGLQPCILCLTQRVPYALNGLLAALALRQACPPRLRRLLTGLCALAFLINAGIAVYHVGVEQHWWISSCSSAGGAPLAASPEDLMAALSKPAPTRPPCDQIPWTLFGISFASYNIVASLGLAAFAAGVTLRLRGEPSR